LNPAPRAIVDFHIGNNQINSFYKISYIA
jgi:hypothetical protein